MLHVILMILRIIGLILLVILGILILAICLILFVPVRYRIRGRTGGDAGSGTGAIPGAKEDGCGGFSQSADATWLFHLLSFRETFSDSALRAELKLAGKTLKRFGDWPEEPEKPEKKKEKFRKFSRRAEKEDSAMEEEAVKQESSAKKDKTERPDTPVDRETVSGTKEEKRKDTGKTSYRRDRKRKKSDPDGQGRKEAGNNRRKKEKPDIEQVFKAAAQKAGDLLLKICSGLFDLSDHVDRFSDKLSKIDDFRDKIDPFLTMSAFSIYGLILRKLRTMLWHFRFRKAEGYLNFGLDRPDLTGMLSGVIYKFLPANSGKFELNPDFHEAGLDTDFTLYGHIRLNHAAAAAISVIVRKDFWNLVKQLKKSRGGAKHG